MYIYKLITNVHVPLLHIIKLTYLLTYLLTENGKHCVCMIADEKR